MNVAKWSNINAPNDAGDDLGGEFEKKASDKKRDKEKKANQIKSNKEKPNKQILPQVKWICDYIRFHCRA